MKHRLQFKILAHVLGILIAITAVLSVYFDIFSGCLQAYIFAMLTMMYVSGAFDLDKYTARKEKKQKKIKKTA